MNIRLIHHKSAINNNNRVTEFAKHFSDNVCGARNGSAKYSQESSDETYFELMENLNFIKKPLVACNKWSTVQR